jgi:pseudouridine-5'-phosphate glycosidase
VFGTDRFPAFWLTDSGYTVDHPVSTAGEIADVMRAADALGLPGGILVANPLPAAAQLDPELHDRLLSDALAAAEDASVRGKDITPFLLEYIHEHTGRASVAVNLDIVRGNCRLGADIARAWVALWATPSRWLRRELPGDRGRHRPCRPRTPPSRSGTPR